MINRIDGFVEEKNSNEYINISDASRNKEIFEKYNHVFNGIKHHIKNINDDDSEYDKDYMKIKFNTDDNFSLNKQLYFPTITVIIRNAFEKDGK